MGSTTSSTTASNPAPTVQQPGITKAFYNQIDGTQVVMQQSIENLAAEIQALDARLTGLEQQVGGLPTKNEMYQEFDTVYGYILPKT